MIYNRIWVAMIGLVLAPSVQAAINSAYITDVNEPWGVTTNIDNMNQAFGAGNWSQHTFGNALSNGVLTDSDIKFIYVDGGDGTDTNFVNFITANNAALEAWVAAGNSLLLNAATWFEASPFAMGFGGTSNQAYTTGRGFASAVNPLHPIFNTPFSPTGTSWTGNFFSHNDITGSGFTALIEDGDGLDVLVEKSWGTGHVMLGGMTATYFHSPQTEADNLKANILAYGLAQAETVPEPTTILIWAGLGLAGAYVRRRRAA